MALGGARARPTVWNYMTQLTNVQDDELATDQTNGKLCWDNIGIKVQEMAKDKQLT